MTEEEINNLWPAFVNYIRAYDLCCEYRQTFRLLKVYCQGLMSQLARKSAEPIALAAGVAVRTLQEFLRDHCWSYQHARDLFQHDVLDTLDTLEQLPDQDDDLGTIGVVDETGTAKKGTKTPGVQRQWCGLLGKVDNCIVSVHIGVAKGRYKALIDAELYLPKSWANDPKRCREADIPEGREYQPKWQIALRQILRSQAVGFTFNWMTFDEGYGSKPGFLDGLEEYKLSYVGEVPCSFSCFTREPAEGASGHRADDLARHSPVFYQQDWQEVRLARQTLGEQIWEAKMATVYVRSADGTTVKQRALLVARNERTGEVKYFICGGREADLVTRLRVGFQRFNVEHSFRLAKSELGFSHFEGRSYIGLMRHQMLCLIVGGFVAKEAASLREKKSGGNGGAGVPGDQHVVPGDVGEAVGQRTGGVGGEEDPVLPTSESGRS